MQQPYSDMNNIRPKDRAERVRKAYVIIIIKHLVILELYSTRKLRF